ncbi:MAG: shikimate kinase, partial [Gammaproteobacteria bacterium]|nr:shikimate kinase [Gammaproteobacteria bacterium]
MGKAQWTSNDNIFLVGPMGAGKTTIGLQLARQFGRRFYDSDKEIEKRTGATIPLIFELEGEEGFRKRETQVIGDLAELTQSIIATGGGAVLKAENRAILKEHGLIIYLKADIEHL